jgi:hypothetical protein
MKQSTTVVSDERSFRGMMRAFIAAGITGVLIALIGYVVSGPEQLFQAYLHAFVFWLGISLGLLGLLLLHFLMNSHWGLTIRRIAEAGAASIWVMGLLFIPLLFVLPMLFPWARPEEVAAHPVLQAKSFYLNVPFFIVRAAIYFVVWVGLAVMVNRQAARLGQADDAAVRSRLRGWGAAGLIVYVLTMTFASVDWLMSLQPMWNSSIFGLIIVVGQVLTALAFAVVILNVLPSLSLGRRWTYATTPVPYSDLGALMFTFVFGWTYLAYFQYLIIWSANIPRETVFYAARSTGGWNVVAWVVALFQFILPFLILLSVRARHNLRVLAVLAMGLLGAYMVNMFWHVKPAFSPGVLAISWLDIVMPAAIGAIWLAVFFYNLSLRPPLNMEEQVALRLREDKTHLHEHTHETVR